MVSEIYAAGRGGTSAFVIAEDGVMVHYGSHRWQGTVSFEGMTCYADDAACEAMAIVCALMMCAQNGRKMVNVYTRSGVRPDAFAESLERHAAGIDVFYDAWPLRYFNQMENEYYSNPHAAYLEELLKSNKF